MHQVGTSSLLIYMMHGHTYIKLDELISQIYSGMKLYMFRTVRLTIIRSLFTVHSAMVYVIHVCEQLSSRIRMEYPDPARKLSTNLYDIYQRFSNCGPRTTSGPRVLPCGPFRLNISPKKTEKIKLTRIAYHTL